MSGVVVALVIGACSSDKGTNNLPSTGGAAGVGTGGVGGLPMGNGGGGAANGGAMTGNGGTPPGNGGTVGSGGSTTGGVTSTGGANTGGAGGAANTGGMAGIGGGSYVCSLRASSDPGGTGVADAMCCSGAGTCKDPAMLTTDAAKSYGHDTCGTTLKCAPTMPTAAPASCVSKVGTSLPDGLEGRCVPKCFLLGNPLAPLLDAGDPSVCPANSVCAPCYSPVDAKATGACSTNYGTGSDMPMKPAPAPYQACPKGDDAGQDMGGGLCVPSNVIMKLTDKMNPLYNPAIPTLRQDNCAMGEACVPADKAANPGFCSPHCTTATMLAQIDPVFVNGACTPEYVIYDTNGNAGVGLVNGTGASACPAGQLCAPCANPLTNGTPSGACY
jgi:hypothetical protein